MQTAGCGCDTGYQQQMIYAESSALISGKVAVSEVVSFIV